MLTAATTSEDAPTPLFKATRSREDALALERLDAATSLLSGWVWETDADHRFTFLSDSIETFTGRPPEWHYGKTREEIGNVCDQCQQEAFLQKLRAHEPFSAIELTRRSGNEEIHMRVAGEPLFRGGEFFGYRGIAFRISSEVRERRKRREAEREHAETLAAFKEIVALFPNAIVVFDSHRRLAFANKQYFKLLGMREKEVWAHDNLEALVEALALRGELVGGGIEDIVNRQVALAKSGKPFTFQRSRPDGSILKVQGFPLHCGGSVRVFTDVTLQAEDKWTIGALQEKIKQLSFYARSSADADQF